MWRARPVFISSTFMDMQAERDHLRTHVFPALEERLRERRHFLEWVDLRLGVSADAETEEAREIVVLKVCLAEVRRCRPFLIVLLGGRYGWIPPPERLEPAVSEEGFTGDLAGRSVTELEIELGVLADPEQTTRSIFYLRDPLPYARMPSDLAAHYSDAFAADPGVRECVDRLAALKQRIEARLPGRIRRYSAAWDDQRRCVTDLDAFGQMVLEDMWSELAGEMPPEQAPISWQQAERDALEDFIEDRARDFVGRKAALARLAERCSSPAREGAPWAVCVTGDPGSGKSALFGELCRQTRSGDAFMLAHAAGASPQSASVDTMLRRWIHEIATALDSADEVPSENADPETIESTFASLLGRMARVRRVVVLVDALDQFEPTKRSRFLSWLPRLWPENARLVASAIPGDASTSLLARSGVEELQLAPLQAAEVRGIIDGVCGRYHRTFEPAVIDALLAKTSAGVPAWGNPLWVVLAVEELNLLDADDFARMHQSYSGRPAERLRKLMLDVIGDMPADTPGLYGATFDHARDLFGPALSAAFLSLIAVSRSGWRESDFQRLLPQLSGEKWDALRFAALRRLFRGQLRRRGALDQWDFNHAQMRAAARQRLGALPISEPQLHASIGDHLLALPSDDPLRISETMVHLMASGDRTRAATFYGGLSLSDAELNGATRVLADHVLTTASAQDGARHVCELLEAPRLDDQVRAGVANRFLFDLLLALEGRASLDARHVLADRIHQAAERLCRADPGNIERQRLLSVSFDNLGTVQLQLGNSREALSAFSEGWAIAERLVQAEPRNVHQRQNLSVSCDRIGDLLLAAGNTEHALGAYRQALAIAEELAAEDRDNAIWLDSVSKCHENVGNALSLLGRREEALAAFRRSLAVRERLAGSEPKNPDLQHALAVACTKVGDVMFDAGLREEAAPLYRRSVAIIDKLAAADPASARWQRDLCVMQDNVGRVFTAAGKAREAVAIYRKSLAIRERLAETDPAMTLYRRDLVVNCIKLGDILSDVRELQDALALYEKGKSVAEKLCAIDPGNAQWHRDLGLGLNRTGDALAALGRNDEAQSRCRQALAVIGRLAQSDPANALLQRDLTVGHNRLCDLMIAAGNREEALAACRTALAISERLASRDAGNLVWQRDASASCRKVGDLLARQGRSVEALDVLRRSVGIAQQLVAVDATSTEWRHELWLAQQNTGDVLAGENSQHEALQNYLAAVAAIKDLAEHDPSNSLWQRCLAASYGKISDALMAAGRSDEAIDALEKAVAIREWLAANEPVSPRSGEAAI